MIGVVHGLFAIRSTGFWTEKWRSRLGLGRCSVYPAPISAAAPTVEVPDPANRLKTRPKSEPEKRNVAHIRALSAFCLGPEFG